MDPALWCFLLNNPESSIPYPWERYFNLRNEILFYENMLDGSIVIDLRSQINLGGGLYHFNSLWEDLTGLYRPFFYHNQDYHSLIEATCCGPRVYLLAPEVVQWCPVCGCHVPIIG